MLDNLELLDDTTPPDADAAMLVWVRGRAGSPPAPQSPRRHRRLCRLDRGRVRHGRSCSQSPADTRRHSDRDDGDTAADDAETAAKPVSDEVALPNGFRAHGTVENPTVACSVTSSERGSSSATTLRKRWAWPARRSSVCSAGDQSSWTLRQTRCRRQLQRRPRVRPRVYCQSRKVDVGRVRAFHRFGRHAARERSATLDDLFLEPNSVTRTSSRLGPVPVEIVVPDLTAQIELSVGATYTVGGEAKGTLVVDNHRRARVHYTIDCNGVPPYSLLLALP